MSGHEDAIVGVIVLMPVGILLFFIAKALARYTALWNRWVFAHSPWAWLGEAAMERGVHWSEVWTLWVWRIVGSSFIGLGFWMLIIDLRG